MTIDVILQLLPEWLLLIGACFVLMMGASARSPYSRHIPAITTGVVALALMAALICGRPADDPVLPGLVLGSLTYFVRVIGLGVGVLLAMVNWYQPAPEERGEYASLVLFSLLGLLLVPSSNDLVVLFFAIELVGVPTYVLVSLSRVDRRASEAGVKYFFLGAMAAALLAYGFALLYGVTGTTRIAPLPLAGASAAIVDAGPGLAAAFGPGAGGLALMGLLFAFGGLCFKVAAAPFHAYAPDVYEGAASPMTALLGFVPKLAGFAALIKLFSAGNWQLPVELQWVMWWVAAVTMTLGNVLALLQTSVKRILAYSSIAHSGYMMIALLVGPVLGAGPMRDGVAALLFYIAVYGVMNLGAFAALAAFTIDGRAVEGLDDLKGLSRSAPLAALCLAICAFSLMGFPPTAGMLGKVYVFSSAFSLESSHLFRGPLVWLAVIGVVNSAIGAAYYLKIASACYLDAPTGNVQPDAGPPVRWGLAVCGIAMILLFVWPSGLAGAARSASPNGPQALVTASAR